MATSIKFYIKMTKRVKEKQPYPIYLRVVHNLQKSEGRMSAILIPKCDIDYWSVDHQRYFIIFYAQFCFFFCFLHNKFI